MDSAEYFREKAARCRRLAASITDKPAEASLLAMALEFDTRAVAMDAEAAADRAEPAEPSESHTNGEAQTPR